MVLRSAKSNITLTSGYSVAYTQTAAGSSVSPAAAYHIVCGAIPIEVVEVLLASLASRNSAVAVVLPPVRNKTVPNPISNLRCYEVPDIAANARRVIRT